MIDWLHCKLTINRLTDWLIDYNLTKDWLSWLIDNKLTDALTDYKLSDKLTDWLIDWLIDYTHWQTT